MCVPLSLTSLAQDKASEIHVHLFISLEVELLGHELDIYITLRNCQAVFQNGCTFTNVGNFQLLHILVDISYFQSLFFSCSGGNGDVFHDTIFIC